MNFGIQAELTFDLSLHHVTNSIAIETMSNPKAVTDEIVECPICCKPTKRVDLNLSWPYLKCGRWIGPHCLHCVLKLWENDQCALEKDEEGDIVPKTRSAMEMWIQSQMEDNK